jgi:hypothetical protein
MKTPLDKQVYAGLMEILRDKQYYYRGSISPEYSRIEDDGKQAILEFITIMAPHMLKHEEHELNERSKKLMMDVLKS